MGRWIAQGLIVLLFAALGFLFHHRKAGWLIAGYNTSSKEEKGGIDVSKLYRYMARFMWALAALWGAMLIASIWQEGWAYAIGIPVFLAVTIGFAIFVNTGGRLAKKE